MRVIKAERISREVQKLWQETNFALGEDIVKMLRNSLKNEKSSRARDVLSVILENVKLAKKERRPICQDTGLPVVFLEIGQDVSIKGGDLVKAINKGISKGTREGLLRPSVVNCPFKRENTGNNTKAVIHSEIVNPVRELRPCLPQAGSNGMR